MNQIALLRRLTGAQRLEQALKLSDFVRELSLKNIRQGRKLTKIQAMKELRQRIEIGEEYHAK